MRIEAARILRPDGAVASAVLEIADGRIRSIRHGSAGSGPIWLPGIVDLHGDAFERQWMPRPGVHFPIAMALADNDRQLLSSGITTAFHGLTLSWEPGLRGESAGREFLADFHRLRSSLRADSRLHLRFEAFALDHVALAIEWMRACLIDLLAFNDHLDYIRQRILDKPLALMRYTDRTGLSGAEFRNLVETLRERREDVPVVARQLAACARECSIPMASHDDDAPSTREFYHGLGCSISEFPVNAETAAFARQLGNSVVLGAPNVVRGGSHVGRLTASQAARDGLLDILCSDYYYPALLAAPFRLTATEGIAFGDAWAMVSSNPARAANLFDRGTIAEGMRADLILVDDAKTWPAVVRTIVAGEPVFTTSSSCLHVSEAQPA
jgi:alpha-D-ribose 1-methylphosphonate 5-triphosphate diphosphatase